MQNSNFEQTIFKQKLTRRDFARLLFAASASAVVEQTAAATVLNAGKKSLPCLSAQTASGAGERRKLKIEGELLADLHGQNAHFLFATGRSSEENAAIVRFDLRVAPVRKFSAGRTRAFGEAVFAPRANCNSSEIEGYLLVQGFDAGRSETFLEIRDAATLDFAARVWAAGQHFPLKFHGNFYRS